jgi:uncharacterized protein (TIGR00255 family)
MTGFGAAEADLAGYRVRAQLRAVNHRGLDVRVQSPRALAPLEPALLSRLKGALARGRVELAVEVHSSGTARRVPIDHDAFAAVAAELTELARANALAPPTLAEILSMSHLFETSSHAPSDDLDDDAVLAVVDDALARFIQARATEGQTIQADLDAHLDALSAALARVGEERPALVASTQGRLRARLEEAAAREGVALDADRVAHEVLLFADRCDIAEELQRALAHVARLRDLLADAQGGQPHGKKIDFYLQELIRETNTMASKSNLAELTEVVVSMKATIEQMREQAANIE